MSDARSNENYFSLGSDISEQPVVSSAERGKCWGATDELCHPRRLSSLGCERPYPVVAGAFRNAPCSMGAACHSGSVRPRAALPRRGSVSGSTFPQRSPLPGAHEGPGQRRTGQGSAGDQVTAMGQGAWHTAAVVLHPGQADLLASSSHGEVWPGVGCVLQAPYLVLIFPQV